MNKIVSQERSKKQYLSRLRDGHSRSHVKAGRWLGQNATELCGQEGEREATMMRPFV